MPLLNFKKRFVEPIMEGTKSHTIRFRKQKIRKGQLLYAQTGPRFKPTRFAVLPAMRVREIVITRETVMIWEEDGHSMIVPPRDLFAQCDGFGEWFDMQEWFDMTYGVDRGELCGQLIQWAEAEWERPARKTVNLK